MPKPQPLARRDLFSLLVVLLIAAYVRLDDIGTVPFLLDEPTLSEQAMNIVSGKSFPLLGLTLSVGFPSPAGSAYLMAIPYAMSDSPVFATAFVAVLNVIGVGLLWWIARRYFSPTVALIAGIAYAVNPWALMFSRRIWPPDLQTPFLLLAFWIGCLAVFEKKRWAQVACLPVLIFAAQVYVGTLTVLPAFVWLAWTGRKHLSWRLIGLSVVITAVTLIPFFTGVTHTGLYSTMTFFSSRQGRELTLGAQPLTFAASMATGVAIDTHIGARAGDIATPSVVWIAILGGATLLGMVIVWRRYRHLAGALVLWAVFAAIFLTPTWTFVQDHYLIASLPAFALLLAIGVEWVTAQIHPLVGRAVLLAGLGAVLLTQAVWWRGMLNYVNTHYPTAGYGTPLHYMIDVREALSPYRQVILVTNDYWMQFLKEPIVWDVLLRNRAQCLRAINSTGMAIFPAESPFAVLTTPRAASNPVNNLYQTAAPLVFSLRPGEGDYRIDLWSEPPEWWGPAIQPVEPVTFDNGIQLTGYHLDSSRMFLEWTISGPPGADVQYFGHFLDSRGERIGQIDAKFLPGKYWCAGDRIVTWADAQRPEGVETLRVGLYIVGEGQTAGQFFPRNILDEAGNPAGQWVDIPLGRDTGD